jgi:hypothetical protein
MRDGPEQEKNGEAAYDGAHTVYRHGGRMRVAAKKDNKKAGYQQKQRGAGRMRNAQGVGAGNIFSAIPHAYCLLDREQVNRAGNGANHPSCHVVYFVEFHI